MKITYKIHFGRGTLLNPTYRSSYFERTINCARVVDCGNLLQLYDYGGYTICTLDKADVIKIEK